jgi:hypothetical protein
MRPRRVHSRSSQGAPRPRAQRSPFLSAAAAPAPPPPGAAAPSPAAGARSRTTGTLGAPCTSSSGRFHASRKGRVAGGSARPSGSTKRSTGALPDVGRPEPAACRSVGRAAAGRGRRGHAVGAVWRACAPCHGQVAPIARATHLAARARSPAPTAGTRRAATEAAPRRPHPLPCRVPGRPASARPRPWHPLRRPAPVPGPFSPAAPWRWAARSVKTPRNRPHGRGSFFYTLTRSDLVRFAAAGAAHRAAGRVRRAAPYCGLQGEVGLLAALMQRRPHRRGAWAPAAGGAPPAAPHPPGPCRRRFTQIGTARGAQAAPRQAGAGLGHAGSHTPSAPGGRAGRGLWPGRACARPPRQRGPLAAATSRRHASSAACSPRPWFLQPITPT